MEKLVSGKKETDTFFGQIFTPIYKNESFVGRIIKPFYTVKNRKEEVALVWSGMILLWLITLCKLWATDFVYIKSEFSTLIHHIPLRA